MRNTKLMFLLAFLLLHSASGLTVQDLPEMNQEGEQWVVLVAGSKSWMNYRHQADVCHAYQIVHDHGVPEDHIIVMMADDIAQNEKNPTPGEIINEPNGTDVYHGVPKDYTGENLRPDIFLQVLQGEETGVGSGKTLRSGPNDNVFVYFADHGAPGLVCFGHHILKATDLNKAIMNMHQNKKYKNMVFYVEACESGSMFENLLPDNINVFATTASDSTKPSYASMMDPKRHTFLSDLYSIKWMQNSDQNNIQEEALETQYRVVKRETTKSPVCKFGDLSMGKMAVGDFQGRKRASKVSRDSEANTPIDAVASPEVPVAILQKKIDLAGCEEEAGKARKELKELRRRRKLMKEIVESVINSVTAGQDGLTSSALWSDQAKLTNHDCYYTAVDLFHERCFNLGQNEFALRMLKPFVNLCEKGVDVNTITQAIRDGCTHSKVEGIH